MSYDIKIKNGDLALENGDLKKVVDSEKLIQDILKLCLTTAGSNPLFPAYGSLLSRTIVGSAHDTSMLEEMSRSQLSSALDSFKNLQNIQIKSLQRMSSDEQLGAILDIAVYRDSVDYRIFNVKIKAVTKGLKPITTAFRVSTI